MKVSAHTGSGLGLRLRAGLHAGEVEHRTNRDLTGMAVHVAARVMDIAKPGHVLVTRTIVDLTSGGDLEFEAASVHKIKGISQPMELYRPNE